MRVRQYSISSSPLWNPTHITVTFSVLDVPSMSKVARSFLGVGSNYLASMIPGDRVQRSVRPSAAAFNLPEDPMTPVVMFCSGSGLAPMRGFIQERAVQKASGRDVGEMLLFFGCRSPKSDFLYSESDLAESSAQGVVDIRPAFSRSPEDSEGCKYVQQ
jgi:cytochrome P450/NADPH-cytochrome P450 reductase